MDRSIFTPKQIKMIILLLVLGVLLIIGLLVYRSVTFRVIGTDPALNSVSTVSPFFKVSFSKTLSRDISVSVSPNDTGYTYKIDGSSVKVLFSEELSEKQDYTIRVINISDTTGKKMTDQIFHFTPKIMSSDKLSDEQKQAIAKTQQDYKDKILSDPLVKLLPFRGGGNEFLITYTVNYLNQQPKLVIVISYGTERGKQDALTWIRQVGSDPTDYNISYVSTVTGD